jgi:hypothetical protein
MLAVQTNYAADMGDYLQKGDCLDAKIAGRI